MKRPQKILSALGVLILAAVGTSAEKGISDVSSWWAIILRLASIADDWAQAHLDVGIFWTAIVVLFLTAALVIALAIRGILFATSRDKSSQGRMRLCLLRVAKAVRAYALGVFRGIYYSVLYRLPILTYQIPEYTLANDQATFLDLEEATCFFNNRFRTAFPDLQQQPRKFTRPADIAHRLEVFLGSPLGASSPQNDQKATPVRWTNGRDHGSVKNWYRLKPGVFILDQLEIKITKLLAVPGDAKNFVYIEGEGLPPIFPAPQIMNNAPFQPYYETVALLGLRRYSLQEYHAGSYQRRRRVKKISGHPQLRRRYLTPSNFLIVPANSPMLTHGGSYHLKKNLDACLAKKMNLEDFSSWLLSLRNIPLLPVADFTRFR